MSSSKHLVSCASLLLTVNAFADTSGVPDGTYEVDPQHGYILFSYSHFGLSNPSVGFNKFDATLELDSANPEKSAITVAIDANSIDSRVPVFDDHLRDEQFFNTKQFPGITFEATSIEAKGDSKYAITGDLTMKGITKPITLDASIVAKMHPFKRVPAVGVSATGKLLRSDWDLGAYAPSVSDEVTLTIEVEILKDEE
ncbi:MAG: YceI family protein [Woeseiaceae bacterium]|nr:YceI family protein [Woeseiaceae bacterium]